MSTFLETIMRYIAPRHPEHTKQVREKAETASALLDRQNEEASRLNRELRQLQATLSPPTDEGLR